eukprot:GSChrysophyteH1.ASY1.ANO1.410.1 assembled CDS
MEFTQIGNIGNMGLSSLLHEPVRLNSEAEKCNEELEELVMQNYRVFVENLTCSVELRVEDQKLTRVSQDLSELLSRLSQQCASFCDRVNTHVASHKRNRKTLQHHMQLVELLEVPQLVDACARNDFFDEALELANFVNGLERRHLLAEGLKQKNLSKKEGGGQVIASIISEVHATLLSLRSHLIAQLIHHDSLSKALSLLAILRKLDGSLVDRQVNHLRYRSEVGGSMDDEQREKLRKSFISSCETRLQMEFLEARTMRLQSRAEEMDLQRAAGDEYSSVDLHQKQSAPSSAQLSSVSAAPLGPYGKAVELLETARAKWLTVVTQFNALFSTEGTGGCYPANDILSAWVSLQTKSLLRDIKNLCVEIEEGAALRAVLEQALFFGHRMAQIGCDFKPVIIPIFEEIIMNRIESDWNDSLQHLTKMLETERYDPSNTTGEQRGSSKISEQVVPLFIRQTADSEVLKESMTPVSAAASSTNKRTAAGKDIAAPQVIGCYPPLAFWMNSLLKALNLLRECPLFSIQGRIAMKMRTMMQEMCDYLITHSAAVRAKGNKYVGHGSNATTTATTTTTTTSGSSSSKSESLDRMYARVIAQDLIPHTLACFDGIFGKPAAAAAASSLSGGKEEIGQEASVEKTPSKAAGASRMTASLHVERLLDAQPHLSKQSYETLSTCWTSLRDAGLINDAIFTPSPVPARGRPTETRD